MKNDDEKITLLNSDLISNSDKKKETFKTTDINILLNRVRLDKKNTFKKRIFISFCFVITITSVITYFIL